MTAKLEVVANHPNRGGNRFNNAAANPTPKQVVDSRAAAGLTQEKYGALAFSSWRTVQDWESGDRRCRPDTWQLIQVKLKIRELLKRGRIAPQAVKDLGLELPDAE